MPQAPGPSFTHNRAVRDDGAVTFHCSSDQRQWPFLALQPQHPIVVQTLQYWASVEASLERGAWDPSKWTALTWAKWTSGAVGVGRAAHGVSEQLSVDDKVQQRLTLFDANDVQVYEMQVRGVVFQNRDFESWRAKSKKESPPKENIAEFHFAPPEIVGSTETGPSFLSPLQDGETPSATALIAKENGLPPAHRFMTGSGDHVNATHLAEAGHQFLHLLNDGAPMIITGGEMSFTRYVELGRPFQIDLTGRGKREVSMLVSQADKPCTVITLNYKLL